MALLKYCVNARPTYITRNVDPSLSSEGLLEFDTKVDELLESIRKSSIPEATRQMRDRGNKVSHVHLRYINPFNPKLGELLAGFKKVLVCELNMGQLRFLLRAQFLIDAQGFNKVQGRPFTIAEVCQAISEQLS